MINLEDVLAGIAHNLKDIAPVVWRVVIKPKESHYFIDLFRDFKYIATIGSGQSAYDLREDLDNLKRMFLLLHMQNTKWDI